MATTIEIDPNMGLDNDYFFGVGPIRAKVVPTGVETLQTGLLDVTAYVATDDDYDDTAVGGLSITLTEDGSTAIYRGKFNGSAITAALAPYVGQTVYLHLKRGTNFHRVYAVVVRDPTPMDA